MLYMRLRVHFSGLGKTWSTRAALVETISLHENLRPVPATKTHNRTRLVTGNTGLGSKSETKIVKKGACPSIALFRALSGLVRGPLLPDVRKGHTTEEYSVSRWNRPKAKI